MTEEKGDLVREKKIKSKDHNTEKNSVNSYAKIACVVTSTRV